MTAILDLFNLSDNRIVVAMRNLTGLPWLVANTLLLVFLLLLSVLYVAQAFVRSPAAWIDAALFVWLAPQNWYLAALCCLQAYMRRAPWLVREYLVLLGVQEVTAFWAIMLPGSVKLVMSNEDGNQSDADGSGTGSDDVVLPQQHQAVPEEPDVFESVLSYLERHKFTDEQVIDLFTVIQRERGHVLSANKIREVVGGNEATVKARVARRRPKPEQPQPPRVMGSSARPEGGW